MKDHEFIKQQIQLQTGIGRGPSVVYYPIDGLYEQLTMEVIRDIEINVEEEISDAIRITQIIIENEIINQFSEIN